MYLTVIYIENIVLSQCEGMCEKLTCVACITMDVTFNRL